MAVASVEADSFSLLIINKDKIYLVDAPSDIAEFVRSFIIENWSPGLQDHTEDYACSQRFKLVTNPFNWDANAETRLVTNRFMRLLLQELSRKNWHLILCYSKAYKTSDAQYPGDIHVVWFFRYYVSQPSKEQLVCLSLASSDRLQLVNGNETLNEVVRAQIEPWIQREETFHDDFIYKIQGNPWKSNDFSETVRSSRIMMEIFTKFHKLGYRLKYQGNIRCLNQCFYFQWEQHKNTDGELELMVLALTSSDKIRIIDPPEPEIVQKLEECITQYWQNGIQDIRKFPDEPDDGGMYSTEFKLHGNPWMTDSERQSYAGRYLITKLLEMLLGCGWAVFRAFDIQSPWYDKKTKSIIVLQKCQPVQMHHVCLQFWAKDTIRILHGTNELSQAVREVVQSHWPMGIQHDGPTAEGTIDVIQMDGTPWKINNENMLNSARLLNALLKRLNSMGWSVIGSLELSVNGETILTSYDRQNWFLVFTGSQQNVPASISVDEPPPSYDEVMTIEKKNYGHESTLL